MQVGIDVGATKIESVLLEKDGQEKHRSRISCPKNYTQIITSIRDIHRQLEQEFKQELPIGVCHPMLPRLTLEEEQLLSIILVLML